MITIDWLTQVISVPQAYLTPQGGDNYELDLNQFHLDLRAIEASSEGIPFPKTHFHFTSVEIGGASQARVVGIINGYTVTFEDGQYAVNFSGANTDVHLKTNVNQVSVRPNNSFGLVDNEKIDYDRIRDDLVPHIWAAGRRGNYQVTPPP